MLTTEHRRITSLDEIDFSALDFQDLHWWYGVFQCTSTGSGRDIKYGAWIGVKTGLGEIEEKTWYQAAEKLICQKGEQKLLGYLTQWCSERNNLKESASEIRKKALRLHIDRIFDDPRWVDFVPFNRRYRPDVLKTAHLVTVVNECCQEPGVVTQEQIDAAHRDAIACPCCGRWSTFTIVNGDSSELNQQSGEQQDRLEMA